MVEKAKKRSGLSQKKLGNLIFYCCLLAIPVLQFCFMYIGVNINSVLLAFKSYDALTGASKYVGFDNFARLFKDIAMTPVYRYSFTNALIAYVFSLIIGMTGQLRLRQAV